jgi:TetR/AcrR family transcriptional regulator, cholesterol catabolism regulator
VVVGEVEVHAEFIPIVRYSCNHVGVPNPPTRPGTRPRYDARRAELIDTAARVFAARGYHATSITDLLEATGLTRGGLYHYIDGKADLLIAVQHELLDPLNEAAEAAVAETADPEDQLRAVTRLWVAHVGEHRDHMAVFAAERRTVESDPRWEEVLAARNRFEALLRGIFDRGAFGDGLTLRAFLGMVNHLPSWFDPDGPRSPDEIADRFCDLMLYGAGSNTTSSGATSSRSPL